MSDINQNQLKKITYALLPFYQIGQVAGWITFGMSNKTSIDIAVPVIACCFLCFVGFYAAAKITEPNKKDN